MSRLIHPRLLEKLRRDFFPQSCAIQQPVKTQSTSGQEVRTWEDVPGWNDIPCRVKAVGVGEHRLPTEIYEEITHVILLAGVFNGLTSEMQATVDGIGYDILLPEQDSEGITTRLNVRLIE